MEWVYNDGGRASAGFKGDAGDCTVRAIAIACELPYREVYDSLTETVHLSKAHNRQVAKYAAKHGATPRNGMALMVTRAWMQALGWDWVPTVKIGSGCKVHLRADELPPGRLVVRVSKHLCAVIDGVLHDTHDCSREGTRCVYGYWANGSVASHLGGRS